MQAAVERFGALEPAWRELEARTPVKLRAIKSDRHYKAMVAFMNGLLDEVGDRETHPLAGLLDVVATFVRDYEEQNAQVPQAGPAAVLRFLMDRHDLRQTDLAEIFGAQSNVSEVLNGKREINARQARAWKGLGFRRLRLSSEQVPSMRILPVL